MLMLLMLLIGLLLLLLVLVLVLVLVFAWHLTASFERVVAVSPAALSCRLCGRRQEAVL